MPRGFATETDVLLKPAYSTRQVSFAVPHLPPSIFNAHSVCVYVQALAGFIVIGVGLSFTVYFCFFSVPLKQNEYLPPEVCLYTHAAHPAHAQP